MAAAAAGEARRVLVYGGRGALGSRCVQAFRAHNWVMWRGCGVSACRVGLVIAAQELLKQPRGVPGRAVIQGTPGRESSSLPGKFGWTLWSTPE